MSGDVITLQMVSEKNKIKLSVLKYFQVTKFEKNVGPVIPKESRLSIKGKKITITQYV